VSLERLKLLTAKTPSFDKRSLGKSEISWEDVAAALAKTHPMASKFTRVVYAGEHGLAPQLHKEILLMVLYDSRCQDWTVKIRTLRELIWICLMESITGRDIPVRDVKGDKMKMLGISRIAWYRNWSGKYAFINSILYDWERHVARTVGREVKG